MEKLGQEKKCQMTAQCVSCALSVILLLCYVYSDRTVVCVSVALFSVVQILNC